MTAAICLATLIKRMGSLLQHQCDTPDKRPIVRPKWTHSPALRRRPPPASLHKRFSALTALLSERQLLSCNRRLVAASGRAGRGGVSHFHAAGSGLAERPARDLGRGNPSRLWGGRGGEGSGLREVPHHSRVPFQVGYLPAHLQHHGRMEEPPQLYFTTSEREYYFSNDTWELSFFVRVCFLNLDSNCITQKRPWNKGKGYTPDLYLWCAGLPKREISPPNVL